jgi:hypothetical protein
MSNSPSQQEAAERAATIRSLNDAFRRKPIVGRVAITPGVDALPHGKRLRLFVAVLGFADFGAGNDPYNEHDFGAIDQDGVTYFWKIDYYDPDYDMGSADPADQHITRRVLTVMRADEY